MNPTTQRRINAAVYSHVKRAKKKKTAPRFPRIQKNSKHTIESYGRAVYSYLMRIGIEELNLKHLAGEDIPTVQELAKFYSDRVWDKAVIHNERDSNNTKDLAPGILTDNVEVLSFRAAETTFDVWSPEWKEAHIAMSAKGGRNGARPTLYTVADLEALPEGLSKVQQAEALGCSVASIGRLRAAQRAA